MLEQVELVGFMRAEFARATLFRRWQLILQFGVAIPAGVSVFVSADEPTYYLALAGFLLLVAWLAADWWSNKHRDSGEAARRALLLWDGLGQRPSASALLDLRRAFSVSDAQAQAKQDPNYYASAQPPGPARLAEIVEESAFWTAELQSGSGWLMLLVFGGLTGLIVLAAAVVLPAAPNVLLTVARLFLVFLVFALSADVWGTCTGHFAAARDIRAIQCRVQAAGLKQFPEADVLLATADYSAAVEAAPMQAPIIYRLRGRALNTLWQAYRQARIQERQA